ncbi:MAG: UDP-glucose 4-epimerase GalE [Kiritimatiellae bacterium]|nr:UDP-glucose 4-epimerase GalE [Kiritimatiellia bacterium]
MKVFVTGGAGYIGSHTIVELLETGHDVVTVDNLQNSSKESLSRVEKITGRKVSFHEADIRDEAAMRAIITDEGPFDATIHFAAMKCVSESTQIPLRYYENNLGGTFTLLKVLDEAGCRNIVFSSSCAVYGQPASVPLKEDTPLSGCTNAYGWTKLMMEQVFRDVHSANPAWNAVLLRYFNPIGAHASGMIGEDPHGIPNNLLPYIAQVAIGRREKLNVYGGDYPTVDGTGVRDFIHVTDLARAHIKAVEKAVSGGCGLKIYNIGTGRGYSVLQILHAFERVSDRKVPYEIKERRPGDVAECWADPALAGAELDWRAERDLDTMCKDLWNWQVKNPNGFDL